MRTNLNDCFSFKGSFFTFRQRNCLPCRTARTSASRATRWSRPRGLGAGDGPRWADGARNPAPSTMSGSGDRRVKSRAPRHRVCVFLAFFGTYNKTNETAYGPVRTDYRTFRVKKNTMTATMATTTTTTTNDKINFKYRTLILH